MMTAPVSLPVLASLLVGMAPRHKSLAVLSHCGFLADKRTDMIRVFGDRYMETEGSLVHTTAQAFGLSLVGKLPFVFFDASSFEIGILDIFRFASTPLNVKMLVSGEAGIPDFTSFPGFRVFSPRSPSELEKALHGLADHFGPEIVVV